MITTIIDHSYRFGSAQSSFNENATATGPCKIPTELMDRGDLWQLHFLTLVELLTINHYIYGIWPLLN